MGNDLEIDPSQEIISILESIFLISIACEPEDGPAQARRTPAKQPCFNYNRNLISLKLGAENGKCGTPNQITLQST
jgi:hypothetical protein